MDSDLVPIMCQFFVLCLRFRFFSLCFFVLFQCQQKNLAFVIATIFRKWYNINAVVDKILDIMDKIFVHEQIKIGLFGSARF